MKSDTSKTGKTQQYLKDQEQFAYQKFLYDSTRRAVEETKQANIILDDVIAQLEESIAEQQEESKYLMGVIEKGTDSVWRTNQEKYDQMMWDILKPKMDQVEKQINILDGKTLEFNQNCAILEQLKNSLEYEQERCRMAKEQVFQRQNDLKRAIIENEDCGRQFSRLTKILTQYEQQNEQMFALKKKLNNELQQIKGNIRVYCRVRPSKKGNSIIKVTSDNTLQIIYQRQFNRHEPQKYTQGYMFQQIFCENQTQESIFRQLSQLIQSSIDGKNVCIFTYGQTGSGKTFTLLGPDRDNLTYQDAQKHRGIVHRSMELIFWRIAENKNFKWNFRALLSIQEIYLENIIDLMKPGDSPKEKDKCNEIQVKQVDEVLTCLRDAMLNRKKAATNMNEHSSRSHLIITLRLEAYNERNQQKRLGSLVFVDLAGSQRLKTSKVEGHQLKETQFINKSLSALGTVIIEMRKNAEHVSFRNSKLTHVLQRYLQGDSQTLMFVNVSPDQQDVNQTKISLSFAENVRDAKMKK